MVRNPTPTPPLPFSKNPTNNMLALRDVKLIRYMYKTDFSESVNPLYSVFAVTVFYCIIKLAAMVNCQKSEFMCTDSPITAII